MYAVTANIRHLW